MLDKRAAQPLLRGLLMGLGLYGRARREADDLELQRATFHFRDLPPDLDGIRLLFFSDLHVAQAPWLAERMMALLNDETWDVGLFAGDVGLDERGPDPGPGEALGALIRALTRRVPLYAVLGNNDRFATAVMLSRLGARVLLNGHAMHASGAGALAICGVDDPHWYGGRDDLREAMKEVPGGTFTILLSHSPSPWREAGRAGVRLLLAGHTHGGQLCLPGGRPLFTNSNLPADLVSGGWTRGSLQGYTSRGVGTAACHVRLHCPPEITLITLRRTGFTRSLEGATAG